MKRLFIALIFASILTAQTSPFPGSLDTNQTLGVAVNNCQTQLSANVELSGTSITVASTACFSQYTLITIDSEIMQITAKVSSRVLTVTRAFNGSTAARHYAGAIVSALITAWYPNAASSAIQAIEGTLNTSNAYLCSASDATGATDVHTTLQACFDSGASSVIIVPPTRSSSGATYGVGSVGVTIPNTLTSVYMAGNVWLKYSGTGACVTFTGNQPSPMNSGSYWMNCQNTRVNWNSRNGGTGTDTTTKGFTATNFTHGYFHLQAKNFATGFQVLAGAQGFVHNYVYPTNFQDNKIGMDFDPTGGGGTNQNWIYGGELRINGANCQSNGPDVPFAGTKGLIMRAGSNNTNIFDGQDYQGGCIENTLDIIEGTQNVFRGIRVEGAPAQSILFKADSRDNIWEGGYTGAFPLFGTAAASSAVADSSTSGNMYIQVNYVYTTGANWFCSGPQCTGATQQPLGKVFNFTYLSSAPYRMAVQSGSSLIGFGAKILKAITTDDESHILCAMDTGVYFGSGLYCASNTVWAFGSSSGNVGGIDTGISRDSAGVLVAGNGTTGNTTGKYKAQNYLTSSNCSSSASPAVCGSASAGSVTIPAGGTDVVVNTTAVTANSQIFAIFDQSLGTKLGVTCNATTTNPHIGARVAGTSFTIHANAAIAVNPACFSYFIVN